MRIISPQSTVDFERYYEFRWKVLRAPWNQPLGSEKDNHEKSAFHIMMLDEDNAITGVARLHQVPETNFAQIRYMAVDEKFRKSGIGRTLLEHLEKYAIGHGFEKVLLNSRIESCGFYTKYGYRDIGAGHILFNTIIHRKMVKVLPAN